MANKLRHELSLDEWELTVVDEHKSHYYQPGFLFIPFGIYSSKDVVKEQTEFLPKGVEYVNKGIKRVDVKENKVYLADDSTLEYDHLIIATGTKIAPDQVEGMEGEGWYEDIFDFYTFEGSTALAKRLAAWEGGKLVVHVTEMPIKCPVAPIEFALLAEAWLSENGLREGTEITFVTPLDHAFTKPKVASIVGDLFGERGINLVTEFAIAEVDNQKKVIRSWDDVEVSYDLLVTTPTNMGADFVEESGFGDDLNFVPADKHTLRSEVAENIWVIGDAGNFPTSKAGSVVHFQAEVLYENFLRSLDGLKPRMKFDGHANCFIESGYGKAYLIDFNYDTDPLPGTFPIPGIGPMQLLKQTRLNHWGKLMFRWVYWHMLLKGTGIPVENDMSMLGKEA